MHSRIFLLGLWLVCCLAAGCGAKEEKHYPIKAEVIAVELPRGVIIVKHGEIPGLMPAMTMNYVIGLPKEAEGLAPGDKISADLVVSENKGRLEKIVLLEKAKPNPAPASTKEHTPRNP
jgi:Cu/Ag efflux protein CusF